MHRRCKWGMWASVRNRSRTELVDERGGPSQGVPVKKRRVRVLSVSAKLLWPVHSGEVSERFKEHPWKAWVGEILPWVQIPPSPPFFALCPSALSYGDGGGEGAGLGNLSHGYDVFPCIATARHGVFSDHAL